VRGRCNDDSVLPQLERTVRELLDPLELRPDHLLPPHVAILAVKVDAGRRDRLVVVLARVAAIVELAQPRSARRRERVDEVRVRHAAARVLAVVLGVERAQGVEGARPDGGEGRGAPEEVRELQGRARASVRPLLKRSIRSRRRELSATMRES